MRTDTQRLADQMLASARNVLAGLGAVGLVALALGLWFLSGELRALLDPAGAVGGPLPDTRRARKAERVVETCTDPRTGATAPLVVLELGGRAQKGASADYGVALAGADDKVAPSAASEPEAGKSPQSASEGRSGWFRGLFGRQAPEEPVASDEVEKEAVPLYDLLAESKVGPILGRRKVGAFRNRRTGDVEQRLSRGKFVEWVHLIRWRAALDVDDPRRNFESTVEWTPARLGPVYLGLEAYYRQIPAEATRAGGIDYLEGNRADGGARLTLSLYCRSLTDCRAR